MQFDVTLKEIFKTPPTRLLELLCGSSVVEMLNIEQPSVKMRRPDLVVRLKDERILHVELQAEDDDEMPWRMLEYYSPIRLAYEQAPIQIVLYVGENRQKSRQRSKKPGCNSATTWLIFAYWTRAFCWKAIRSATICWLSCAAWTTFIRSVAGF